MPLFDTHRPDLARAHDFLLGGHHNFAADRALAGALVGADPLLADLLRENREFVRRSVRHVAGLGVRQFVDIGSGLPFAHSLCPGSRVAYVDNDPAVRSYGGSLISPYDGARFFDGDLAEPEALLSSDDFSAMIDLNQPVCLILSMVLHLIEESTARGVTGVLVRALAPGGYVIISMTADPSAGAGPIEPFFAGLDVVPPGLGDARAWGMPEPGPFAARARTVLCGLGRKAD